MARRSSVWNLKMEEAQMTNEYNPDGKEIRFIDSHYKDLFHIPRWLHPDSLG